MPFADGGPASVPVMMCAILHEPGTDQPHGSTTKIQIMSAYFYRRILVLSVLLLLPVTRDALGVVVTDLYRTQVPMIEDTPQARNAAFRAALEDIVVRITGISADREDDELEPLLQSARRLAVQFGTTSNGELWVEFDGPALERRLLALDQPIWGRERPAILVWLAVDLGRGDRRIVSGAEPIWLTQPVSPGDIVIPQLLPEEEPTLQELVNDAAAYRGLPLVWPLVDAEDLLRVSFPDVWVPFDEAVLDASQRYKVDGVLVGALRHRDGRDPRVSWTLYFRGERYQETGTLADGVFLAAELFAGIFAVRSNSQLDNSVRMTIAGIESMEQYARLCRYLERLTMVTALEVEQFSGNVVSVRLALRGGSETLRNAIQLGQLLEPDDSDYQLDPLAYPFADLRYRIKL